MLKLHPMRAPLRPGITRKAEARMSVKARNSGPEDWLGQMQWGPIEQILRKSRYDEQTIARVCESLGRILGVHWLRLAKFLTLSVLPRRGRRVPTNLRLRRCGNLVCMRTHAWD